MANNKSNSSSKGTIAKAVKTVKTVAGKVKSKVTNPFSKAAAPVKHRSSNPPYIYRDDKNGGWYFNRQVLGQIYRKFFADGVTGSKAVSLKAAQAESAWFDKHYETIKRGVAKGLGVKVATHAATRTRKSDSNRRVRGERRAATSA